MNWKILGSALLLLIMGLVFIKQGFFSGKTLYTLARVRGMILGPALIIIMIILLVKACSGDYDH